MSRRKSSIDIGSILPWGIAAVAGYWLYSNWASLSTILTNAVTSAASSILPAAAPITPTTGGIVSAPVTAQQLSNLVSQAQAAQQAANDATAAGNPNAPLLQAQAAQALAATMATVPATPMTAGVAGLNRRYFRRRIA